MTERLRAVFDTNVIVSAYLSRSPTSPTQELIDRWLADEFILLVCSAIVDELIEKLTARGVAREDIETFRTLHLLATSTKVSASRKRCHFFGPFVGISRPKPHHPVKHLHPMRV